MQLFILLFSFLLVNSEACNQESQFLRINKDTKLESKDQIHVKGINEEFCLAHCHVRQHCHSVNYHAEDKHCIMNLNVNEKEKESLFVTSPGWMYYQKTKPKEVDENVSPTTPPTKPATTAKTTQSTAATTDQVTAATTDRATTATNDRTTAITTKPKTTVTKKPSTTVSANQAIAITDQATVETSKPESTATKKPAITATAEQLTTATAEQATAATTDAATTQATTRVAEPNTIDDTKEITISKGHLAYTILMHENSWKLTFNLTIDNVDPASTANILHLTSDNSSKASLLIHVQELSSSVPILNFCFRKGGKIDNCYKTDKIELNKNLKVKVRNYFIDTNTQVLMVSINDMHKIYREHNYEIASSPAKLYVSSSDQDVKAAAGKISNLQYKSGLPLVSMSKSNKIEQMENKFGKAWYVDVLMKTPIVKDGIKRNVFHLSKDGSSNKVGDGFPALFLKDENVLYRFDANDQSNGLKFDYNRGGLANDLMYIRMEQVFCRDKKYKLNCYLNTNNVQNKINDKAEQFPGINVWFSDSWYDSPDEIQVYEFEYGSLP